MSATGARASAGTHFRPTPYPALIAVAYPVSDCFDCTVVVAR